MDPVSIYFIGCLISWIIGMIVGIFCIDDPLDYFMISGMLGAILSWAWPLAVVSLPFLGGGSSTW